MKYIDAHCHILTDAEMQNAAAHGVGHFIVNAARPADWGAVVELATRANVSGAVGVHPWYAAEISDTWDAELVNTLVAHPNLMVGEIGLDKNHPNMDAQESVFCRQIQIAHDLRRVAHVHCVGAWGKMLDVLRGCELPPAIVLHAFSGAAELVPELVACGCYFSFGAAVVDERRTRLWAAAASVPVARILVESDAPDVAMPDTIPTTVAKIAEIRGADTAQIADIIYNNTMGLINDGTF